MPPRSTATAISMITMRFFIDVSLRSCSWLRRCGGWEKLRLPALVRPGGFGGCRLLAIPPSAAQRLEERRGVRVPRRLHPHQREPRELVLALRVEQRQVARSAELELPAREVEPDARERFSFGLR